MAAPAEPLPVAVLISGGGTTLRNLLRVQRTEGLPIDIRLVVSSNPKAGGLAEGFPLEVRGLRLSAGAGFVVALVGRIVTMPALPRDPAAKHVHVAPDGAIRGLMQGD